jgi:hypothetical protein
MLCRIVLSVFAIAFNVVAVQAADLPARSRLGAVFAEPSETAPQAYQPSDTPVVAYATGLALRPLGLGYYGQRNAYYNSPYYGSSFDAWAFRLPYACNFYGYC